MSKKHHDEVLVQVQMTGQNSFSADEKWRDQIIGTQACPHCRNIYKKIRSIDAIVNNNRRKTDVDLISPDCGHVRVFSTRFIETVGLKHMERVAGLGRIMDVRGFEHDRHRTAVARHDLVIIRGSDQCDPGLCRKCGRLLYWPFGETYVLRSQIPPEPFFLSNGHVFCTNQYWEDHLSKVILHRVEAIEIPIRDKAEDGLPASVKAMKARLKSRRRFK